MSSFAQALAERGLNLNRGPLQTLQINVGRKCNQACRHCHVDAAPWRTEMISRETAERIAAWIGDAHPQIVDITGGAPELSEHFRYLVEKSRAAGCHVIDRNNLTILTEKGFDDLPQFLARHEVEVIASLPCYLPENVARQRGQGVFERSIEGLRKLNEVGYGRTLALNLVYNPTGPELPPPQAGLETDYRTRLWEDHGVIFSRLFTLANQPIARFEQSLKKEGRLESYLQLLESHFNEQTLDTVMCRSTLSVDFEGYLYDCDFNQMLGMTLGSTRPIRLWEISPDELPGRKIKVGNHCFACTAGSGSSCTGALLSTAQTSA